jgi:DNA topoisomerase VI subunit B
MKTKKQPAAKKPQPSSSQTRTGTSARKGAGRRASANSKRAAATQLTLVEAVAAPEMESRLTQDPTAERGSAATGRSAPVSKAKAKREPSPGDGAAPRRTAAELATKQREISVSEFFTKNRHLLGFDSPAKALLTTVKEMVDNSFDACEEAGILPDVTVSIFELSDTRHRVVVEDNGPGILRNQIPKVFGQLLYGSKFHRLRQSLTADQRVLIERRGVVERVPIGDLADEVMAPGEEARSVVDRGWRVPAFDPQTRQYSWQPVEQIIRHRRENEVFEITTEYGKRVRVTGCHSLFACRPGTLEPYPVEARSLRPGDAIIAPRRLPEPARVTKINLLEYIAEESLARRWAFVYGLPFDLLRRLHARAQVVHKTPKGRSRRYFRWTVSDEVIDVLDESWIQYMSRGFLPLRLVKQFNVERSCASGYLRTYHHGVPCETPVTWQLTRSLMRFLGLWVAEGHADLRQIAFTFGDRETHLVEEVAATARGLGLSTTIESRDLHAVRVKVFGGMLDILLPRWCGRGAHAKRVPAFVFGAGHRLRQHFLDGLYAGDGHQVKGRHVLTIGSVSRDLIADVEALWLLQGETAARSGPKVQLGLGRTPSTVWVLNLSTGARALHPSAGANAVSRIRSRSVPAELMPLARGGVRNRLAVGPTEILHAAGLGQGSNTIAKSISLIESMQVGRTYQIPELSTLAGARVTRHIAKHFADLGYLEAEGDGYTATAQVEGLRNQIGAVKAFATADLCLLRVRGIRRIEDPNPFVYDLSVPEGENFVAGEGMLACHNSRGQQGIGVSAAGMYGQLTTGKPIIITSRIGAKKPAHHFEIQIDTRRNQPVVVKDTEVEWDAEHGTRVELEIEATYKKGRHSVDGYLELTALANPHATIVYHSPKGEVSRFERAANELPREPKEIQPHPHGVELGMLLRMLQDTKARNVQSFLTSEFSRVSAKSADEILTKARISPTTSPGRVSRQTAETLYKAIGETKLMAPPTNCLSPIGDELIRAGLVKQGPADFVVAATRPPAVYRGNPFQVEVGIAYGGDRPGDELAELVRFANRVPLLYQQSACAITRAVLGTSWKSYGIQQSKGALPAAPMLIMVHIASVWVPFTSESKEAIAGYPEILKEIKLALQDCGRKLGAFLRRGAKLRDAELKRSYIEKYIPHIGIALQEILGLSEKDESKVVETLKDTLERSRTI